MGQLKIDFGRHERTVSQSEFSSDDIWTRQCLLFCGLFWMIKLNVTNEPDNENFVEGGPRVFEVVGHELIWNLT